MVTNNAGRSIQQYVEKLAWLGVDVEPWQVLSSAVATASYLQNRFPDGGEIFIIGEQSLIDLFETHGFNQGSKKPLAVVAGLDRSINYEKLKDATLLLRRGTPFIGTNPDLLIPTEEGLIPEAGTTLAALQAATGLQPTVIGKPESHLFEMALRRMGSQPAQTDMLGDRLITDILGAQRAGIASILVTTGVDSTGTISEQEIEPEVVVNDLAELVALWQQQL